MDAMISAAAQNDIGVVLGIFWGIHPPPGEFFMAATVPGSKTYVAMAAFARDLAEHYKDNPAVLGFDVIGELNLNPDQPNGGQAVNERWTSESIQVVYDNLCNAVHSVDPKRMLSSGNGPKSESVKTPRPSRQENQQIP
jgi:hypothetical protein